MLSGDRPDCATSFVGEEGDVIVVGIDVGKRAHHASFLESDSREVTRSLRFANNRQGCEPPAGALAVVGQTHDDRH